MNSDFVSGAQPPGVRSQKQVIRVKQQDALYLCCLSPKAEGIFIHWIGGRSAECPGEDSCAHCKAGVGKKWKAYLDCATMGKGGHTLFLELTETAFDMLVKQLKPGESMRGVYFSVAKTKGGAKGRYLIEVKERRIDEHLLPSAESAIPLLRRLWSMSRAKREKPATNGDSHYIPKPEES